VTTLLALLGSIALIAAIEGVLYARRYFSDRREHDLRRRLQSLVVSGADGEIIRPGRFARSPRLDSALRSSAFARRVEALLEQADSGLTVAQVLGYSAGAAGGGLLLMLALRRGLPLALLALAIGLVVPFAALAVLRDRRGRRLSEQLPEALQMMARSLRAGHALATSFEVVATESPEPISIEFARAFEEQRLGLALDQVVLKMSQRSPGNGDLKIFAVSTIIQKETGGNLAEILDSIAATIRERYRFYGKLRALTAEGRVSGLIVGALPFLVALMLSFLNPGYISKLVDNPLGQMFLLYAVVSWLLGLAWMFQMTRIDV
jgi:tight adherence protein B